ncbi:MAG: Crp/Fnr family transcriptional regulator [Gammaproteobacteria bacterium]|nr:Crp/Fnr family transcriptional regulator [Pseudomonadales bacterium]
MLQLAQRSTLKKLSRRAIVLNAGVREDCLCFLFEGRLQGVDFTVDGREVGLYFVEPGDFCGELGLFDDGPQPEYVIALTTSAVVTVPVDLMRKVMFSSPKVTSRLGTRLAARVRQLTFQRSLLGLPNIAQRVCCQLWALVPPADRDRNIPSRLLNPPTHMEIAIMLNVSRETVTRVFQALQGRQVVKREGPGCLLVNNLALLKDLAEGKAEL